MTPNIAAHADTQQQGKVLEAIDYKVPVGVVAYSPESIDGMYRLFAK